MNIRHLRYFVTLAREGHYGRAATACHVTQPTLSEAIRQLERELAVPLIDREGQRFRGLTPEGERALGWAQRILADHESLAQELSEMRQGLSGEMRFGVIPAAMPIAPLITAAFCQAHPLVTLKLLSLSSIEIQRGLDSGELEAGLTYLENEPLRNVRTVPLYRERYMLLTPTETALDDVTSITWNEAAALRLCLLSGNMQNRRIVDRIFKDVEAQKPRVALETDSVLALIAHVKSGNWSSIVPHTFLTLLGHDAATVRGLHAIPLTDPEATQAVGIVINEREPHPPVVRAFLKSARMIDVSEEVESLIQPTQ